MNPAIILLLLRLLSAALLLVFFGLIAWLIYRDIKQTTAAAERGSEVLGALRVVLTESEQGHYGRTYPLYAVTKIGRSANCTIALDDAFASNEHVMISRGGGQWWLEDLGSRNGTLLNDVLLNAQAVITSGDIIVVGRTALEVDLEVFE